MRTSYRPGIGVLLTSSIFGRLGSRSARFLRIAASCARASAGTQAQRAQAQQTGQSCEVKQHGDSFQESRARAGEQALQRRESVHAESIRGCEVPARPGAWLANSCSRPSVSWPMARVGPCAPACVARAAGARRSGARQASRVRRSPRPAPRRRPGPGSAPARPADAPHARHRPPAPSRGRTPARRGPATAARPRARRPAAACRPRPPWRRPARRRIRAESSAISASARASGSDHTSAKDGCGCGRSNGSSASTSGVRNHCRAMPACGTVRHQPRRHARAGRRRGAACATPSRSRVAESRPSASTCSVASTGAAAASMRCTCGAKRHRRCAARARVRRHRRSRPAPRRPATRPRSRARAPAASPSTCMSCTAVRRIGRQGVPDLEFAQQRTEAAFSA